MEIRSVDRINFDFQGTEETSDTITILFTDANTGDDLGQFVILKKRGRIFLETLKAMIRELYGEFEDHDSAITKLDNLESGQLEFREV